MENILKLFSVSSSGRYYKQDAIGDVNTFSIFVVPSSILHFRIDVVGSPAIVTFPFRLFISIRLDLYLYVCMNG